MNICQKKMYNLQILTLRESKDASKFLWMLTVFVHGSLLTLIFSLSASVKLFPPFSSCCVLFFVLLACDQRSLPVHFLDGCRNQIRRYANVSRITWPSVLTFAAPLSQIDCKSAWFRSFKGTVHTSFTLPNLYTFLLLCLAEGRNNNKRMMTEFSVF